VAVAAYWGWALWLDKLNMPALFVVYWLVGGAQAACVAGNLNFLAKITPPAERTLMVTFQAAAIAMGGGLSALLWGYILKRGGVTGGTPAIDVTAFGVLMAAIFATGVFLVWRLARMPDTKAEENSC
jgi:MFS family permease